MKIFLSPLFFVFIFCIFLSGFSYTQVAPNIEKGDTVRIKTIDLNIFVGKVIEQDSLTIKLETTSVGILSIYQKAIIEIRILGYKKKDPLAMELPVYVRDRSWRKNHNPTFAVVIPYSFEIGLDYFMLISPTGFGLKKGTGYYQNTMLVFNNFGYGFSDRFSVNASLSISSFFDNGEQRHILVTSKYAVPVSDFVNLGIGLTLGEYSLFNFTSLLHGICTIGKRDTHYFSVGFLYGFSDLTLRKSPGFTFSGYFQVSRTLAFITENWFLPWYEELGLGFTSHLSYGIRYLGRKMALDMAFSNRGEISGGIFQGTLSVGAIFPFSK